MISGETDPSLIRLERYAWIVLGLLVIATGLVARSLMAAVGVAGAGLLMIIGFRGLVALVDAILGSRGTRPTALQMAILGVRYVLLALGLYVMLRVPGVGPIPVALGLSIFVIAVVVEGLIRALGGARRDPQHPLDQPPHQ